MIVFMKYLCSPGEVGGGGGEERIYNLVYLQDCGIGK